MRIFRPAHRLALTSILAVLLVACGGGKGADGRNALTAVSPAGENCEHGGSKIEAGVDADGNGSLGSNEISSTHYACDGAGGGTGEPGATLKWVAQSDAVTAEPNTGYIATSTSTLVVTLPDQIDVGDVVRVIGAGEGGWKIAQTGEKQEVKLASLARASWTAVGPHAFWKAVDSSADGKIQVAAQHLNDSAGDPAGHIYISIDGGVTWTAQTSLWPDSKPDGKGSWYAVTCSDNCNRLVAAERGGLIYAATRSPLDGSWTWTEMSGTEIPKTEPQTWEALDSSYDGGTVAALVGGGDVYIWTDASSQWTRGNLGEELLSVAVSSDGKKVVAVGSNGALSIWNDGTWTQRPGPVDDTDWFSVACSNNCSTLVMAEYYGHIYTSSNGGASWTQHESPRYWQSLSASADGIKLVALEWDGRAYVSIDSGVTWAVSPDEPNRHWNVVHISGDGSTVVGAEDGGQIHVARDGTTAGKDGYISGDEGEAIELIYLGNDQFRVLSHEGRLTIR